MRSEEWADAALTRLWDEVGRDSPFDLELLALSIRAAYAHGYMDALSVPEPLALADALAHEAALRLSLPVS